MRKSLFKTAFPFLLCGMLLALAWCESTDRTGLKMALNDLIGPALSALEALRFPDGRPRAADGGEQETASLECARLRHELDVMAERMAQDGRTGAASGAGFTAKGARVLRLSGWNGDRRLAVIDLGLRDGIRPGMGVIKGDAAVGLILRCGRETSVVRFLSDPGCKAAATLLHPGQACAEPGSLEGVVEGIGGTAGEMRLKHVRSTAPVAAGDFILTSGRRGDFPAGLIAGRVESVENEEFSQFLEITLSPAIDAASLRTVAVAVPDPDCGDGEVSR